MAKLLLNTDGKVLTSNDKVLKAPESVDLIEQLLNDTLTSYSNSNVTSVKDGTFNKCTSLTSVSFVNATQVRANAFDGCTSLTEIELPKVQQFSNYAIRGCRSLTRLSFPNLTSMSNYSAQSCRSLIEISIPLIISFGAQVLKDCYSLKKVYIEQTNTICSLAGGVFTGCYHIEGTVNATYNPNGDKDGYIYVPASRLAEYKVATNWVEHASQIIGHQDFNVGDTLPDYTTSDFTTQTWYSDETLTTVVTSVATAGKYYCRLEA